MGQGLSQIDGVECVHIVAQGTVKAGGDQVLSAASAEEPRRRGGCLHIQHGPSDQHVRKLTDQVCTSLRGYIPLSVFWRHCMHHLHLRRRHPHGVKVGGRFIRAP